MTDEPILLTATHGPYLGRPVWVFPSGEVLPLVAGGDGEGEGGGEGTPPPQRQPEPASEDRRFTQAEVTAMMAREKDQGKRAAEEATAKSLGVSLEEAKTIIAEARKRADSEKSEAQKAREAADAEKAAAATERAEAAAEKLAARVETALLRAGVTVKDDKDGTKLEAKLTRLRKLVEVEPDADAATITAAVKTLKDEEPGLFAPAEASKPPNSDPSGKPPKSPPSTDAYNKGIERAKSGNGAGGYALMSKT